MTDTPMLLQEDFFIYIHGDVDKYHPGWIRHQTEQWYNCYSRKKRVILWIKQPNTDGSFWVFVSIPSRRIFKIHDIAFKQDMNDGRKYHVSIKDISVTPIELLDRGPGNNSWEANWPVGFKIIDRDQFELAKKIIIQQWI